MNVVLGLRRRHVQAHPFPHCDLEIATEWTEGAAAKAYGGWFPVPLSIFLAKNW